MTPREQLDELANSSDETIIVADGFDEALLGTATVFCGHSWSIRAVYDRAKCIQLLVTRDGMSEEDADEYFEFNVQGAIVAGAPIFLSLFQSCPNKT
jgi:hypothetical protein